MKDDILRNFFVLIFLSSVTALIFLYVARYELARELEMVLFVVAGMTTISALSEVNKISIARRADRAEGDETVYHDTHSMLAITFDESSLALRLPDNYVDKERAIATDISWDITADGLLEADASLALAKIRIDIERELRRIAHARNIDVRSRPTGIVALSRELVVMDVLPETWVHGLKEVASACNRAVHGAEVSADVAAQIVRAGSKIVEELRLVQ